MVGARSSASFLGENKVCVGVRKFDAVRRGKWAICPERRRGEGSEKKKNQGLKKKKKKRKEAQCYLPNGLGKKKAGTTPADFVCSLRLG